MRIIWASTARPSRTASRARPPGAPPPDQSPQAVPREESLPAASGPATATSRVERGATAQFAAPPATGGQMALAPPPPPPPPAAVQSEPARLPAIPEPPAAAPALDTPRVYGITNGPVRIVIKATAESWIQVRDTSQAVVAMRILKPGESYRVPDRPGLTLATGNAGGLDVTVDGRPVAPVGPVGKRRSVTLDPERLIAGTATAE